MDTPPQTKKKGLGPFAWIGIGCGGIVVLGVIGLIISMTLFGGKIKEFAAEMQKNPARTAATTMVKVSGDKLEMAAEDDANLRYTVREKASGKLTTIYFSAKKKGPEIVEGDFSAIPADDLTPAPAESAPAPAPAQEKN